MSENPLNDRDNKDEIAQLWEKKDLVDYFERLKQWERGEILVSGFYQDLQEVCVQRANPSKRGLRTFEEQRTRFLNSHEKESASIYISWMAACRDVNDDITNLFFALTDRDREKEMHCILYYNSKLRTFWKSEPGKKYLPGIIRFYLRMYNFPAAFGIALRIIWLSIKDRAEKIWGTFRRKKDENQKSETEQARTGNTTKPYFELHTTIFLVVLAFALTLLWLSIKLPNPSSQFKAIAGVWPDWGCPPDLLVTVLATSYVLPVLAIVFLLFMKSFRLLFRCFIPRLMAAIMAGYLFLIFPEDVWKLAAKTSITTNIAVISILALVAAWLLLANEIRNRIPSLFLVFARSLSVLFFGLTQSILIGLVLCDLFGKYTENPFPNSLMGIFGNIYPGYILFAAPLALFIGVFVQIIWDDKAVSEPF